jgi:predicted RNase H-like HicB family nuclease
MKQYTFRTIIEPDDPNGYHGFVPILPGVHTCGRSIKEVKKNLKEAITCHIQGMLKDGEIIPKEEESMEMLQIITEKELSFCC